MKRNPNLASDIKFNAREMRKHGTEAEKVLWDCLRDHKLNGYKFRRQHPMGRYILDFYCYEAKLAIEIDGSIHDNKLKQKKDHLRTILIEETGIKMIRFRNHHVLERTRDVLNKIIDALEALPVGRDPRGEGRKNPEEEKYNSNQRP